MTDQLTEDDIDQLHANLRRARAPFDEAQEEVAELTKQLRDVLGRIEVTSVTTEKTTVQPEFAPEKTHWLEGFPTREEVETLLVRHFYARKALYEAWNALPNEQRQLVVPIPSEVLPRGQ